MQNIINYDDKVALYENSGIADINKVNASDMNEIKTIVNGSLQGTNAMGSIVVDDINCKNLFDKDNYNSLGGFINSSTSKITGNANTLSVYIPIEANTTYTVSKTKGNRFAIATTSATPVFDISLSNIVENNTATSLTLTSSNSAKYLVAYVYNSGADTDTLDSILATLQIEAGSTATTYTPYKKIIKEENGYVKENTTFYANDFKCKNLCNGINQNVFLTSAVNSGQVLSGNTGLYIKVNGGNYTISTTTSQARYRVACMTTEPSGTAQTAYNGVNKDGTSDTITINTSGYNYLIVNATDLSKIQIEAGDTQTAFVPYKEYGGEIYSTNEMVIGRWIDGKPLYRKVIDIGTLPNNTTKYVNHNISDIDIITNYYGACKSSSNIHFKLPYTSVTSTGSIQAYCTNTQIAVQTDVDRSGYSGYIVIEYTKTTSGTRSIGTTEEENR